MTTKGHLRFERCSVSRDCAERVSHRVEPLAASGHDRAFRYSLPQPNGATTADAATPEQSELEQGQSQICINYAPRQDL